MTGFITEEIRESGRRVGFRGVTLDGRSFPLAHVTTRGAPRVGPYGVDLSGLETVGLDALTPRESGTIVVVDEIGKMECLSPAFKERVAAMMDDDTPLLATVAAVGVGLAKRVRNDARARHYTMTRGASEGMIGAIARDVLGAMRADARRIP
jgi:nucleoside-triphosphatase